MTDRGRVPRRAGGRWRILVHDWLGKQGVEQTGFPYGKAHNIGSDPRSLGEAGEHSTVTALPNTEFDELVVGQWLHLEQMDSGRWWLNVGGVTVWIKADRDGRPLSVDVYGPNDYASPVPGCEYTVTWRESAGE